MRALALGVLAALALAAPAAARQPNVLFVITDDQRAVDTLAVMPSTRAIFGRGGTRFPNAFASTPNCCPARATIFSGRYAHNHGVLTNFLPLELETRSTLQATLRRAGYRTAIFGKYLNWLPAEHDPPWFSDWGTTPGGYYRADWNLNGRLRRRAPEYSTRLIGRYGVDFLRRAERRDRQPWLMYLTPSAPHLPFVPERRYRSARVPKLRLTPAHRERDRSDKPPFFADLTIPMSDIRFAWRQQQRTLLSVDDLVERVFGELRRLGEERDTLAFFLSDQGFFMGEYGGFMFKDLPHTQSTRFPLLARWPGRIAAGASDRRLVGNVDLVPTVLEAAGLRRGAALDGRSLLRRERGRRWVLTENFGTSRYPGSRELIPAWASLRSRELLYAEYYPRDGSRGFREWYDLRRDPYLLRNLLARPGTAGAPNPARLERVQSLLRRYRACRGRACP